METLKGLAKEFQESFNLDENNTKEAVFHDAIHGITGLGVALEDERIVLNITEVLQGGTPDEEIMERVIGFIDLISQLGYLETLMDWA